MSARQKSYAAPQRPRLQSQFGLDGAWDGKPRRIRPPMRPRQGPTHGGLSESEFAALTPEEKINLGNGGRAND